ncbi:hypothetical protein [Streptomyces cellulosae]|uniref:hypothetical protein n=1 Tax=Streptomyces cellulosae TaxID=1968 RepID=UPI00131E2D23|nr:hypothetical protein [Streptomyces cellulosae]
MNGSEKRSRRFKTLIALAVVGALAVAGVVAWQVWPSEEPAVAVPARVCDGALSGAAVRELLPEKGKPFAEWHSGAFNPRSVDSKQRPGTCKVYGGGKSVRIDHSSYLQSTYSMKNVDRGASMAGNIRITLGKAIGYYKGDTVFLFADCTGKYDKEKALVEVDVTYEKTTNRATIQNMASLAADTLRLEAREIWRCESADALPNGSPQVG